MGFGETLYKLRQQKGLSQKELAEQLEVAQASINYWEKGQRTPSIDAAKKISDFFDISLDDLTGNFTQFKTHIIEDSPVLSTAKEMGILEDDLFKAMTQRRIVEELDITEDKQELLFEYNKLNTDGQKEARKRVQELTEIKRYTD